MINRKVALITGSAGFIGFHMARKLLSEGWRVIGIDNLSPYYDVSLKKTRGNILSTYPNYVFFKKNIEDPEVLLKIFVDEKPEIIIHLAAQAGVRYSIESPRSYMQSNITGTFELLEAARVCPPKHLLMASTSSVYGANTVMPYTEDQKADIQMSLYAATKKATENIAHSYSHLFQIPITMFRFFTVYGPWGRPDMALFKFTEAIINGDPIDVYNFGDMKRDFTYIDDLINSIYLLMSVSPCVTIENNNNLLEFDSKSPVAPFRIINIGNAKVEKLTDFISAIEKNVGKNAVKNLLPIQPGDVPATFADTKLLKYLTGFAPSTGIDEGVAKFVAWYRKFFDK